jgi:Xaa-Pro aminopeptidase
MSMKARICSALMSLSCQDTSSPMSLVSVSLLHSTSCFSANSTTADMQGKWGTRIESALAVKRIRTKGEFNGDIWLGFERLTCMPIQTRMVKENMLTKDEKQWLKVRSLPLFSRLHWLTCVLQEHNQRCRDLLEPHLRDDKCTLKWLRRECDRGIGLAATGPGGLYIDWD